VTSLERQRLIDDADRRGNWKRWGPYLAERQWGTVREDYSADGDCWNAFTHDQARSRTYRWGEDGLLGFCDRQCRLCMGVALWNGRDPILKERLFGLTGPEGNHGEDVKECYYYLDSSPTHSYVRMLYKYPQAAFPYAQLVEENRRRGRDVPEFELADTGVFDESRYFDVEATYAKASAEDLVLRLTIRNRGPEAADLVVLPTLWFRNTWCWGRTTEGYESRPRLAAVADGVVDSEHSTLGRYRWSCVGAQGNATEIIFTENETNATRVFGAPSTSAHVKDAFHDYIIHGQRDAVNPARVGTKAAAVCRLSIPAGAEAVVRCRLVRTADAGVELSPGQIDQVIESRQAETDAYFAEVLPTGLTHDERQVARQAFAGLLCGKQFYHYAVKEWLEGDPTQPAPPESRRSGRNADWLHLFNRDIISMPDKWEYPWYAAWDLAFHMIPFARVDLQFAKEQLLMLLREWYMHPSGQIPAYEFAFGDVNPPVHAWAVWRVYKMSGPRGQRDRDFLARAFHKLLINFTWWVNRKDVEGKHIFSGGFLGLDNIGVFDRSRPLPTGGHLEQADGTAWMANSCMIMLAMALELAKEDPTYEDVASKFFEHVVAIADAMNTLGGSGLWDEQDGFYYDRLHVDHQARPLRIRSMVGLLPLIAVTVLEGDVIERLPGFRRRMKWFLENRADLARHISYVQPQAHGDPRHEHLLLAIPSRERLERVLRYMLDENEFLSPYGLRSLSRIHAHRPYVMHVNGEEYRVDYTPGESTTALFGGNSNWRGPIWFPVNFLIIEALERYHHFYGPPFTIECPTGSGRFMTLEQVAAELRRRLVSIFTRDADGRRPCHGDDVRCALDPAWRDLVLFHEYFHGETGRGLGASHQTGWTALVADCLIDLGRARGAATKPTQSRAARL
jgi:hypothetical protein